MSRAKPEGIDRLWGWAELAEHWGVSERTAKRMVVRLRVPKLVLGHRTVRFRRQAVLDAEMRAAGERR